RDRRPGRVPRLARRRRAAPHRRLPRGPRRGPDAALSMTMRTAILIAGLAACGGAKRSSTGTTPSGGTSLHSPELNRIMKLEVNQPFSAMQFMVFHAEGGDVDFA